jgi:type IV pilus assembly protein PilA
MIRKMRNKEGGFTLVELMVVVMIIAILMAIAIPTFLNSRKRAQDSAAKSNVRNGLAAAQSVFSQDQVYPATAAMVTAMAAEEPSLTFVATSSTSAKTISVMTDPATSSVVVSGLSKSGKCFATKNVSAVGGGTTDYELTAGSSSNCLATAPSTPPGTQVSDTTVTTAAP